MMLFVSFFEDGYIFNWSVLEIIGWTLQLFFFFLENFSAS